MTENDVVSLDEVALPGGEPVDELPPEGVEPAGEPIDPAMLRQLGGTLVHAGLWLFGRPLGPYVQTYVERAKSPVMQALDEGKFWENLSAVLPRTSGDGDLPPGLALAVTGIGAAGIAVATRAQVVHEIQAAQSAPTPPVAPEGSDE